MKKRLRTAQTVDAFVSRFHKRTQNTQSICNELYEQYRFSIIRSIKNLFFFKYCLNSNLNYSTSYYNSIKRQIHEFADGLTDILVFEKKLLEYCRIIIII